MSDDRRLIEDFLPIQAISAEASREKSVRINERRMEQQG
jgi:adenine-specific DNA methylase